MCDTHIFTLIRCFPWSEYKRTFGLLFAKPGSDLSCDVIPKELTHPARLQLQGTHAEAGKVRSYFQSSTELDHEVPLSGRQRVCRPRNPRGSLKTGRFHDPAGFKWNRPQGQKLLEENNRHPLGKHFFGILVLPITFTSLSCIK